MIDGTVSEIGADVGVVGVDVNRDADDNHPVVIGAGQGGSDRDQAQRGTLERSRQVHPADGVEWVRPGAGGDVGGADLAAGGAARARLLGPARVPGRGRDRALRAVAEAAEARRQPGRHREVEVTEELVAVFAAELQSEVGEVAGDRVRGAGDESGLERALLAGAWPAVGTGVDRDDRARDLRGERRVPRREHRFGDVDPALSRGRHQCLDRMRRGGGRTLRTAPAAGRRRASSPDRSGGRDGPTRRASRGSRSPRPPSRSGTGRRACGSPM